MLIGEPARGAEISVSTLEGPLAGTVPPGS
jgi:hypothetical protein